MISKKQILQSDEFRELLVLINKKYATLKPDNTNLKAALEQELEVHQENRRGWIKSLASPQLDLEVRQEIEGHLNRAVVRTKEVDLKLAEIHSNANQKREALDPEAVAEHLFHLGRLMDGDNAAAANVMLSQHIAAIECDIHGRVVVRTCLLGALANPDQLAGELRSPMAASVSTRRGRRRTRRDVGVAFEDDDEAMAANDFAVDPERYAGFGPEWFAEDVFEVPEKQSWAAANAREVAEYRLAQNPTMETLAAKFGRSVPTIRSALRYAKRNHGIDALGKELSLPTRQNWSRDNALLVAEFFRHTGATVSAAVKHFGKSEPTISKARKFAEQMLSGESESKIESDQ